MLVTLVMLVMLVNVLVATAVEAAPPVYRWISLDVPNAAGVLGLTSLAAINDENVIAGGSVNSSGPGYVLDRDFQIRDILCPGATLVDLPAQPQALNKRGVSVGTCILEGIERPFRRSRRGHIELLTIPGALLAEALGINGDGDIVGAYRDASGTTQGFILHDDGTVEVFTVPDTLSVRLTGINERQHLIGVYEDTASTPHGFVRRHGTMQLLAFPGAILTVPVDINDVGQIVGIYLLPGEDFIRSFLMDNGQYTPIAVPFPGVVFTEVTGINNQGQLVGRYVQSNPTDVENPFPSHGFIATLDWNHTHRRHTMHHSLDAETLMRWQAYDAQQAHHQEKWRLHKR